MRVLLKLLEFESIDKRGYFRDAKGRFASPGGQAWSADEAAKAVEAKVKSLTKEAARAVSDLYGGPKSPWDDGVTLDDILADIKRGGEVADDVAWVGAVASPPTVTKQRGRVMLSFPKGTSSAAREIWADWADENGIGISDK